MPIQQWHNVRENLIMNPCVGYRVTGIYDLKNTAMFIKQTSYNTLPSYCFFLMAFFPLSLVLTRPETSLGSLRPYMFSA